MQTYNVVEFLVNEHGDGFQKAVKTGLKRTKAQEVADKLNEKVMSQDLTGESKGIKSYAIKPT
jgi:hypothetical protein